MPEVHRHEERDFKAGDKILINGNSPTAKLAVVTCTYALAGVGVGVHALDYRDANGMGGWASSAICRKVSDEEWVALILKGGKGA